MDVQYLILRILTFINCLERKEEEDDEYTISGYRVADI